MAPYGQGFDNLLPIGLPYGGGSHGLCHIEDLVNTHANICSFEQPFFFPLQEAASPFDNQTLCQWDGRGIEDVETFHPLCRATLATV